MIRRCLHHDPAKRPKADTLTDWLHKCRRKLEDDMTEKQAQKITGRSMALAQHSSLRSTSSITSKKDGDASSLHWSDRGRYTLHQSKRDTKEGTFELTVCQEHQDEWMEPALTGDEPGEQPGALMSFTGQLAGQLAPLASDKFGVSFTDKLTNESNWPVVVRVDRKTLLGWTLASQWPELREGCKLQTINGQPAPATFKEAAPQLRAAPFTLVFRDPERSQESRYLPCIRDDLRNCDLSRPPGVVPSWLRAGLEKIETVRKHETKRRQACCLRCAAPGAAAVGLPGRGEAAVDGCLERAQMDAELAKRDAELAQRDRTILQLQAVATLAQAELASLRAAVAAGGGGGGVPMET
jgi:hypothetical protein